MKDVDRLFGAFLFGLLIGLMAHGTSKFVKVVTVGDTGTGQQERNSDEQSDYAPTANLKVVARDNSA